MNASKAAREICERGAPYLRITYKFGLIGLRWEIRRALRAERVRGRAEGAQMVLDELRTAKKEE